MSRPAGILTETEKEFETLKGYVGTAEAYGVPYPIDSEFASAACRIIYNAIRAVLEKQGISPNVDFEEAYSQSKGVAPPPPSLPGDITSVLVDVHRRFNQRWVKPFDPSIDIDRPSYLKHAGEFISWARGLV